MTAIIDHHGKPQSTTDNARPDQDKMNYAHTEKYEVEGIMAGEDGETTSPRHTTKKSPVEISLVRKLDWIMMPMLWVSLQTIDGCYCKQRPSS